MCTNLFQEIVEDVTSNRVSLKVKVNVHILAKSAGVVIPVGACIPKALQDSIRLEKDIFHPTTGISNCFKVGRQQRYKIKHEIMRILVGTKELPLRGAQHRGFIHKCPVRYMKHFIHEQIHRGLK